MGAGRDDTDLGSVDPQPRRRWARRLAAAVGALVLAGVLALVVTVSPEESVAYPEGFRWEQHELDQGLVTRRWTVGIPEVSDRDHIGGGDAAPHRWTATARSGCW